MMELLALGCQEIKILFNARRVASLYMTVILTVLPCECSRYEGRALSSGAGDLQVLSGGKDGTIGCHRGHDELGKVKPDGADLGGVGWGQRVRAG